MVRGLIFFIKLALLIAIGLWLSRRPGEVSIDWLGYRLETSVGILLLASLIVIVVAAILYRIWLMIRRTPKQVGNMVKETKKKRGYAALTQGMVAVAAGDVEEAERWSKKADATLDEPPLTMLLSAQAAQLSGDEAAAERYFKAMLERKETKFLGLRGLLNKALREGDHKTALSYVRQAYALRPQTPWVQRTLFDLSERSGNLLGADTALKEASRRKSLPATELTRKQALLALAHAKEAQERNDHQAALKHAKAANKADPRLVPAAVTLAEAMVKAGRRRDAQRMLEKTWAEAPHPDLVKSYKASVTSDKPLDLFKALEKLIAGQADHPESRLAMAEAALDAELWGEARRFLKATGDTPPSERACHLMARLEDGESGKAEEARSWLLRAAEAPADPTWVCNHCGAIADDWSIRCQVCDELDGLSWRQPPRAATTIGAQTTGLPVAKIEPAPVVDVAEESAAILPAKGEKPPAGDKPDAKAKAPVEA